MAVAFDYPEPEKDGRGKLSQNFAGDAEKMIRNRIANARGALAAVPAP
jgi:hypothetical protein